VRKDARDAAAEATSRAERLAAILNMTADGIVVIDARGTIESFNLDAQRLFGYAESEVVGRNVSILHTLLHHEVAGIGLGLPTTTRMVEAHGGRIVSTARPLVAHGSRPPSAGARLTQTPKPGA
jgi:PAS domain-containing protein